MKEEIKRQKQRIKEQNIRRGKRKEKIAAGMNKIATEKQNKTDLHEIL